MPDKPQKTVFVLGAGASAASDFHLPVMKDFLARLSDERDSYPQLCTYLRRTYRRRKFSGINLEDVYTQLELDLDALASIRGRPQDSLIPVKKELQQFIRSRLDIGVREKPQRCSLHSRLLAGFPQGSTADAVLTLNYDLVVDSTLWADASDADGRLRTYGPLEGLYDLLRPRENIRGAVPSLLSDEREAGKYLKLHGSWGWLYCSNGTCPNHHVFFPEYLGFGGQDTGAGDPCALCGTDLDWVIVPPTMKKSFEQYPKLGLIWRLAHEVLKAADRVVFFGVSMAPSDYYLHWLIRSSLVYRDLAPHVTVIDKQEEACRTTERLTGTKAEFFGGEDPICGYFAKYAP